MDLDGADILSTLHALYSMTFTALGKSRSNRDFKIDVYGKPQRANLVGPTTAK